MKKPARPLKINEYFTTHLKYFRYENHVQCDKH